MQNFTVYTSLSGVSSHLPHSGPNVTGLCFMWRTWLSQVQCWREPRSALAGVVGKDSHSPATTPSFLRAQGPQMFISAQSQCLSPVSSLISHSQACGRPQAVCPGLPRWGSEDATGLWGQVGLWGCLLQQSHSPLHALAQDRPRLHVLGWGLGLAVWLWSHPGRAPALLLVTATLGPQAPGDRVTQVTVGVLMDTAMMLQLSDSGVSSWQTPEV